jgi:hypothetical protein
MTASTSSPWPEKKRAVTGLLLGQLEVQTASDQGDDESVGADALLLGSPLDFSQQVGGEGDELLGGVGHERKHTACDMLPPIRKAGPARLASPGPMALGVWS